MTICCFAFHYVELPNGSLKIEECPEPINVILINKKNKRHLAYCEKHWLIKFEDVILINYRDVDFNFNCKKSDFHIITDKNEMEIIEILLA